jgi:aminoglycoside phosphotransferase (APT) family kinase protein
MTTTQAATAAPHAPFAVDALERYMGAHVAGFAGPLEVEPLTGGQSNPTFRLRTHGAQYVLRKKPAGTLLPSAHAVEREYRVMSALRDTDVPVPRTYALCEDATVIGTPFLVMDFVEGRIHWDPTMPGATPQYRAALWDDINRVIAAIHAVDVPAAGLADYGKPGNYFERQIARWTRQYRASETEHIDAMDRLIEWLPSNIPANDETTITHGDFRIDNLVVHPDAPRVLAVLDWELSTLGHPLADFAYHALAWRLTGEQFRGMAGRDFAALGIPTEREYVDTYCRRTGRAPIDPPQWEFHLAYSMFRLAAILQGIARRVVDGTAAGADAGATGRRARPIAEEAWRCVEALR